MGRPYERRFGMPFNKPEIPFGAMVEYHPISGKDQSRLHQFGAKCFVRGWNLESRLNDRRHLRIGGEGRI